MHIILRIGSNCIRNYENEIYSHYRMRLLQTYRIRYRHCGIYHFRASQDTRLQSAFSERLTAI